MTIKLLLVSLLLSVVHPSPPTDSSPAQGLAPLRVSYMLRGYFYAGSKMQDRGALGGFWASENYPVRLDRVAPPNAISLIALLEEPLPFDGAFQGFRVVLANTTADLVELPASDSRLSIVREALDTEGNWKPIEYLPSSWCGNSYHRVFLPPGHYWSFAAPIYEGSLQTEMRFVLYRGDAQEPIYSNTFDGSVNPEQFSVQQGHRSGGLMDPYTN